MTDLVYNDHQLSQLPIHDLIMPIMAMISTYNWWSILGFFADAAVMVCTHFVS